MSTASPQDTLFKALEAALILAAERDWDAVTMLEIATHAELSLQDIYSIGDRDTITDSFDAWADRAMFSEDIDLEDTPKEKLFETIMRRFEAIEPYRPGTIQLMRARDRRPLRRAALIQARRTTAKWALACSGLDNAAGAERALTELGLVWVISKTERAWRSEKDDTFTATMATLDEELAKLQERSSRMKDRFSNSVFSARRPSNHDTDPQTTTANAEPHATPQSELDQA